MNMSRLRPPPGCEDLALWLSGVINDAIRDAREAGLDQREIWMMLDIYTRSSDPLGYDQRPGGSGGSPIAITRPIMWGTQHDGRHEQDRWDAMAWLEMFGGDCHARCECAKCEKVWANKALAITGSAVGLEYASRNRPVARVDSDS